MTEAKDGTGAGLLLFLAWAGDKGELNSVTAKALASAVRAMLSIEAEPNLVDIRSLDVDRLMERFDTLNRTKYSTGSMSTYKSRFRQSVAMYLAWLDNNSSWKMAGKSSRGSSSQQTRSGRPRKAGTVDGAATAPEPDLAAQGAQVPRLVAYDVPLRPDMIVRLTLPFDLTQSDAERVATFVRSLAFAPAPRPAPAGSGAGRDRKEQ